MSKFDFTGSTINAEEEEPDFFSGSDDSYASGNGKNNWEQSSERTENPGPKNEHENEILVKFVMDSTLSFGLYKQTTDAIMFNILNTLASRMRQYHNGYSLKLGLTLITGKNPRCVMFDGNCFTNDYLKFNNEIRQIKYSGGSTDGYEAIFEAIESALGDLKEASGQSDTAYARTNKSAKCGLVLITDSIPKDRKRDLRNLCDLRFAVSYVYDPSEFTPIYNLVDRNGEPSVDEKNSHKKMEIKGFLSDPKGIEPVGVIEDILVATSLT